MRTIFPCFLLMFLLSLMACEIQEELLISDIGDFEPKLHLSGYVSNDSIYACLTITQKQQYSSIYNQKEYEPVVTDTTAKVTIYEDGHYFCTLTPKSAKYSVYHYDTAMAASKNYYISHKEVTEGKNYSIKVEHKSMGQIEATTMLPKTIDIQIDTTSSFRNVSVLDDPSRKYNNKTLWITDFTITINDQPKISNYYWLDIRMEINFDNLDKNNGWREFDDVVIEYDRIDMLSDFANNFYYPAYLFTDKYFNGQNYQLNYSITSTSLRSANFKLHYVSEELYKYYASINDYGRAALDPFSKPVQLYSNTTNGLGIWGAKNAYIYTFKNYQK